MNFKNRSEGLPDKNHYHSCHSPFSSLIVILFILTEDSFDENHRIFVFWPLSQQIQ